MADLIRALLGRRWCGWCTLQETSRWERLMGGHKYHKDDRHWWKNFYWGPWMRLMQRLPFWKIGWWWHGKRHETPPTDLSLRDYLRQA